MKRYLLSLLLVCAGFISFGFSYYVNFPSRTALEYTNQNVYFSGNVCFNYVNGCINLWNFYDMSGNLLISRDQVDCNIRMLCFNNDGYFNGVPNTTIYAFRMSDGAYIVDGGGSSSCDPQYTSEECQSEYYLVPLSDLSSCQGDLSSCNSSLSGCQSNLSGCMINLDNYSSSLNNCSSNLNNCNTSLSSCMSSNCPVSSGNVSWSSLFINNIQHLGAPIIDITIPEEFDWDYVSTDEEFTLDIEGYNVDTEYMNGIITTQTTLPNDIDFNNIISSIVPLFVPGIVIIFFLYFVFKFIKKIF